MFIEASSPRVVGEEAHLYLGVPSLTGQKCLSFWYSMYGVDIGQLLVYGASANGFLSQNYLWSLAGQQTFDHTTWLYGQVTVDFDEVQDVS